MLDVKSHTKPLTQLGDKPLVAVALLAPQVEVAMGSPAIVAKLEQHAQ